MRQTFTSDTLRSHKTDLCKVIAEGVEDYAQLYALASLNCDFVQGYIWGKPTKLDDLSNCL